jgi:hypothetical protein
MLALQYFFGVITLVKDHASWLWILVALNHNHPDGSSRVTKIFLCVDRASYICNSYVYCG